MTSFINYTMVLFMVFFDTTKNCILWYFTVFFALPVLNYGQSSYWLFDYFCNADKDHGHLIHIKHEYFGNASLCNVN